MDPLIFAENRLQQHIDLSIYKDFFLLDEPADFQSHLSSFEEKKNNMDNSLKNIIVISSIDLYLKFEKEILSKHTDNYLISFIIVDPENKDNLSKIEDRDDILSIYTTPLDKSSFKLILKNALKITDKLIKNLKDKKDYSLRLDEMKQDQDDLINIGRSLTFERDTDKLLRLILMVSKKITGADAGSIYIVEDTDDSKQIRFKFSHTFSKDLPLEEFVIPFDKNSIAGYTACTGKVLNIPDVYNLSKNDPISFNNKFDKKNNYRSRSMLVVPMRNHLDEIIGVIQLINSKVSTAIHSGNVAFEVLLKNKDDFNNLVKPFDQRYEFLMEAVASQAAIAIENSRMVKQIESQFEEFVKASVTAIESRDPATSGHSFRVAEICKKMALKINETTEGKFKETLFTDSQLQELHYAALLHDFGKVYIDLSIFKKSRKLFPEEMKNLLLKLDYLYKTVEVDFLSRINNETLSCSDTSGSEEEYSKRVADLENEKEHTMTKLKEIKKHIEILNEPTITVKNPTEELNEIFKEVERMDCYDLDGKPMEIISDHERENLSILRGSLNSLERKEIESHVTETFNFVSKIPWPPEFKDIPHITLNHHEKIDGTGYPNQIKGEENIPLQARMMAIADIFDALTASDRPYKKAMSYDLAIKILEEQAFHNKISGDLLDIFKQCGYENDEASEG